MDVLVVFASTLCAGALISQLAHRTVLSTALLFLAVGVIVGPDVTGLLELPPGSDAVYWSAEVALFAVLFTDGLRTPAAALIEGRRSLYRTLGVAMPLTIALLVLLGVVLIGLPFPQALLLAGILAPTDPVLAEAIVGRAGVPDRLASTLNLESSLNDGIALPLVAVVLGTLGSTGATLAVAAAEVAGGVVVGFVLTWLVLQLERSPLLGTTEDYEAVLVVAIALLVFGVCSLTHANLFLAAFTSGITVVSIRPEIARRFSETGSVLVEVVKLAALLLTGMLLATGVLSREDMAAWLFALAAIVIVRPVAVAVAMIGSRLDAAERTVLAWFGPRGFASVTYALLVARSHVPFGDKVFMVAAATIAASMLVHSSTDVLAARWLTPSGDASDRSSTAT